MTRALVYGLAVAGESTVRALQRRDIEVVVADDEITPSRTTVASTLNVELIKRPRGQVLDALVGSCDLVCPAPGVPETHELVRAAKESDVELVSEIELAYRWEQQRPGGPRPMLAITGTDGKTTTTLLAVEMLRAAGLKTVDAGNTLTPLVDAIEQDLDAFVVECTSFRLAWTPSFRAEAAVWLNLAPDHLNWHRSMSSYEAAKARVFANQGPTDVAIGFVNDEAVMRHLATAPGQHRTFGANNADYCLASTAGQANKGGVLSGPAGEIAPVSAMRRSLPHDITNALAASALVLESGLAGPNAITSALTSFEGPAHRLEHVATWDDIAWFNDSKATTPHAASAAIRSFENLILIAGGYDKGVDLSAMAANTDRIRAVIALGATAPAVAAAFSDVSNVRTVDDLAAAVTYANEIAQPGNVVLFSPGCASFDQYKSFEQRGDHFRSLVQSALSTTQSSLPGGTS